MKNVDKLVNETLVEASGYLDRLIEGIKGYLDLLHDDIFSEASKKLVDIIEGLEWEFNAIALMQDKLNQKFELQGCLEQFKQLNEAIEKNDRVLLGDLFEYEIIPMLEKWDVGLKEEVNTRGLV